MVSATATQIRIFPHYIEYAAEIGDQYDNHRHLEHCLEFAPVAGGNHDSVVRSHQPETADNKLSAQ